MTDYLAAIASDPLQQVTTIVLGYRIHSGTYIAETQGGELVYRPLEEGVRAVPTLIIGNDVHANGILRALHAEIERVLVITHDDPAVNELRSSLEVERKRVDQLIDVTLRRIQQ